MGSKELNFASKGLKKVYYRKCSSRRLNNYLFLDIPILTHIFLAVLFQNLKLIQINSIIIMVLANPKVKWNFRRKFGWKQCPNRHNLYPFIKQENFFIYVSLLNKTLLY